MNTNIVAKVAILSLLVSLSTSTHVNGVPYRQSIGEPNSCCPNAKASTATMYFSVDNDANYISVNGVKVVDVTTDPNSKDWQKTKVKQFLLAPGDVLCINGNNQPLGNGNDVPAVNNPNNPAAMIATLYYKDCKGRTVKANTDNTWLCDDGLLAKQFNQNNDPSGNSIWYNVKKGKLSNISNTARWIWNHYDVTTTSTGTCCYLVPCCDQNKSSRS